MEFFILFDLFLLWVNCFSDDDYYNIDVNNYNNISIVID